MSGDAIKSMQLYPRADRILRDLRAAGYADDAPVPVAVVNRFDQLHYHGTEAIDAALERLSLPARARVVEVGAGWGGCARHIAARSGAHVTAVELQADYDQVARLLTQRTGLRDRIAHVHGDFLICELPTATFDAAVSWLALFHIPDRPRYLARTAATLRSGGRLWAEDLTLKSPVPTGEADDFRANLFPNSLVDHDRYAADLANAGFDRIEVEDMTDDWAAFTADRLRAFRENRAAHEAIHGADGWQALHHFYDKMAGYFARGIVGGVRVTARVR